MSARYAVTAGDCAGELADRECETLEQAVAAARELRAKYPRALLTYCSPDRCDYADDTGWCDGLTEDERETLEAV